MDPIVEEPTSFLQSLPPLLLTLLRIQLPCSELYQTLELLRHMASLVSLPLLSPLPQEVVLTY